MRLLGLLLALVTSAAFAQSPPIIVGNAPFIYIGSVIKPPSEAAGVGYNVNTFSSDSFSTSNVDISNSQQPGFQWYKYNLNGTTVTSGDLAFTGTNNNVLQMNGGINSNGEILTAAATNGNSNWVGTAFGGGAYFEMSVAMPNPSSVCNPNTATCGNGGVGGWPILWALTLEGSVVYANNSCPLPGFSNLYSCNNWPGQGAGFNHGMETDWFENHFGYVAPAFHESFGVYNGTCWSGTITGYTHPYCQFDSSLSYAQTSGLDLTQFHRYGVLWVPATSSTQGYEQYFIDDVAQNGTTGGAHPYQKWTQFVNTNTTANLPNALSNYCGGTPGNTSCGSTAANPGSPSWAFGVLDTYHRVPILGTNPVSYGSGGPMYLQSFNVWQASAANNLTGMSQTAAPTFSPAAGTYSSTQSVTISSATPSSTVYYCVTTTTCTPTTASSTAQPVSVSTSESIYAIATSTGLSNSTVSSAAYTINSAAAAPTFTPAAGAYSSSQSVTLASTTPSASIYYCVVTSGSCTPSTASTHYTGAITVSSTETIYAIATASGYVNSSISSAAYEITSGATVLFDYSGGFASAGNNMKPIYSASVSGGKLVLLPAGSGHAAGGVFYANNGNIQNNSSAINVTSGFRTEATFQMTPMPSHLTVACIAFVIQNTPLTPASTGTYPNAYGNGYAGASWAANGHSIAADANACGYGSFNPQTYGPSTGGNQDPLYASIGIKFDANPLGNNQIPASGQASSTGLYTGAGPWNGLAPFTDLGVYGINLYSNDVFSVVLTYDGSSQITMVLTDTVTGATVRKIWPVNIQNCLGSSTGWIGFTAGQAGSGTGGATAGNQGLYINGWKQYLGFNTQLATPTLSPAAGSYSGTQTVTVTCPSGALCYYTTNGKLPTASSTKYTTPISVPSNEILQVVAIESGFTDSNIGGGLYQINTSNHINFPSGFAANDGVILAGSSVLSGSAIQLTNTTSQSGSAWFAYPVPMTSFTKTYQLSFTSANADGMASVVQNNPAPYTSSPPTGTTWPAGQNGDPPTVILPNWMGGPDLVAINGNQGGYGAFLNNGGGSPGITNSVALYYDLYNNPNSVGLYTNGATPTGNQLATGLTFSNHTFNVTETYSGTSLVLSMTDASSGANYTHTFTVNIPSTVCSGFVGACTAYSGFVGGTGGLSATQKINSWVQ